MYDPSVITPLDKSTPCKILEGIRVIESASYVAGPTCGRLLADYGAEVIKIECPTGDAWRKVGKKVSIITEEDANPFFDMYNSGKKSVVIDQKDPEQLALMKKLISTADVFLTNARLKSLEKIGLDPVTLRKENKSLIYASLTGYGIEGKERDMPGFDSTAFWSRSGMLRDLPLEMDDQAPIGQVTSVGDTMAGSLLFSGILGALFRRERTGEGDFVTTSLLQAGLWVCNAMVMMCQDKFGEKFPISRYESDGLAAAYKCSDGEWFQLGLMDYNRYIPPLLEVLGIPELFNDPRFCCEAECRKKENMSQFIKILEGCFLKKTAKEWFNLLVEKDIFGCILPHFRDVSKDQQAWDNGYLENFVTPSGFDCVMVCPPVRFGSTGSMRSTPAPYLGQDTDAVLLPLKEGE